MVAVRDRSDATRDVTGLRFYWYFQSTLDMIFSDQEAPLRWILKVRKHVCLNSRFLGLTFSLMLTGGRAPFTDDDDQLLVKYLATYSPGTAGRCGNKLYTDLVENVDKKWPWSKHHTWQSWRERYIKNKERFNHRIRLYQKKKNLPQEHRTVPQPSKPKPGSTTVFEEEADDNEEARQRKRKRVSEAGNGPDKRPKHDQAPSVTRPVQKRANAQAGAVAGPSKHRQISSGQAASSKTGTTINQEAMRPLKSGPPPAENTNTEGEDEAAPVHSDDYRGEIFDQEPDDESEVNAMLTDGMDEEIHDPPELPKSPYEDHEVAYPDLKTLPSPNLTTRELHLPGQYDSAYSRPASHAEVPIQSKRRTFLTHPSQEPTPPVSGADDSTLIINARVPAKKPAIRPLLLKDPSITNPTHKNHIKSSKLRRQNIDDDPFETPPPTPIRSQPAPKPKRPPILVQGGFRTAFNLGPTGAGSDSDSAVEIVEAKKTWPPQRNKGVTTPSKTLVKPKNGLVQKVEGKGNDQNVEAAPLTNGLKGTETVVDRLTEGGIDENHVMDVDDKQADGATSFDKGVEGKTRFPPIQLAANGQSNNRNGKGRADIESEERPSNVTKVNVTVNTKQGQTSMIPDPPRRRRQPVQVNAVATSSKVTLADLPKVSLNSYPQLPYESASMTVESLSPKPIQQRLVQSSVSPPSMAQISSVQKMKNYQSLREAGSGTSSTDSIVPQSRPLVLSRTLSADIPSTPVKADSVTLVEKVEPERKSFEDEMPLPAFTSTPLNNTKVNLRRMATRRSLVHRPHHESSEKRSPRMDLREVALRRRTSLFQSTSGHTSSRSSTPLNISRRQSHRSETIVGSLPPEELEFVFEFGVRGALAKMAADLGFAYKPVRLIFEQTKSFSKTLVVLRRIMEAGNKVGNEMLAELALEEEDDEDEQANQSHILDGLSPNTRHKPEAKRPSLNVKPVLDDDQISEYSPPTKSRAGQFSRLVRQGREDEALSRERRRSGPLPRDLSTPMQPPTPSPPPTLHPKAEPGDLTSDTRKLSEEDMYDLFGGPLSQSTIEDSQCQIQPEPNVQEIKAEFERLAMTVTAHDTTALEEFEQKLDPDLLRAWTMELILERTAPPLKSSP
ncbi:uncharacterized protein LACBIDRAFT_324598 [Laccaria bicolor S238N-H82]|uniref:Predicted protein n=1 Tax=Laccaria bicolor (strain S238N-H82 / ATCC MYA-4686) TaxID=486041 RepID=B0D2F3_LACBS|nr:uncharacterized protein LACBIDRAFT_324598 [Laccaria bicolor S238N-H82]EDR11090.1 predicted protein [Laccaria bicolor S238N-H82]|eukprot:XP_001878391.1 predicted protein [Laccaria bicolor S238N-H82]